MKRWCITKGIENRKMLKMQKVTDGLKTENKNVGISCQKPHYSVDNNLKEKEKIIFLFQVLTFFFCVHL